MVDIKGDSGEDSERERRAVEKASVFLEDTCIRNRILLEIWMLKVLLVKFQAEMRNVLLDTGGKAMLAITWQNTWLNYVTLFERKIKLVSTKLGYLAEEISEVWKVQPDFSLPLTVKCKNEKLRKELVSKKEQALGFGKFAVYPDSTLWREDQEWLQSLLVRSGVWLIDTVNRLSTKHCSLGWKGPVWYRMKGVMSDFWDSTSRKVRTTWLWTWI